MTSGGSAAMMLKNFVFSDVMLRRWNWASMIENHAGAAVSINAGGLMLAALACVVSSVSFGPGMVETSILFFSCPITWKVGSGFLSGHSGVTNCRCIKE